MKWKFKVGDIIQGKLSFLEYIVVDIDPINFRYFVRDKDGKGDPVVLNKTFAECYFELKEREINLLEGIEEINEPYHPNCLHGNKEERIWNGWLVEKESNLTHKFKPGDIVKINGYQGNFVVKRLCNKNDPPVKLFGHSSDWYVVERPDDWEDPFDMFASGKDMKLIKRHGKQPKTAANKKPVKPTTEKEILQIIEDNKIKVERLKLRIDWALDDYNKTGDEKYLNRAKRLQKLIDKLPTSAVDVLKLWG